jgi:hypothetical protein
MMVTPSNPIRAADKVVSWLKRQRSGDAKTADCIRPTLAALT